MPVMTRRKRGAATETFSSLEVSPDLPHGKRQQTQKRSSAPKSFANDAVSSNLPLFETTPTTPVLSLDSKIAATTNQTDDTSSLNLPLLESTPSKKALSPDTAERSMNVVTPSDSTPRSKKRGNRSAVKPRKSEKKLTIYSSNPPEGWLEIYTLVQELRQDRTAPCDHFGAEALPDRVCSPKDTRFQVLISLMLSAQTKDGIVGEAVRKMQQDNVLTVDAIRQMSAEELNSYINKVGFHNNKTKYIKAVVDILAERYDSDIPETAKEMMTLPGVGPKMAYICESVAWKKSSGIGVDTHMHRLFNMLGWVNSARNPEQSRLQLEAWLPREYWGDVNLLWVGFGQEVQQFRPKLLRKALDCSRPEEALKLLKRCGLDYVKEGKKLGLEEEIHAVFNKS